MALVHVRRKKPAEAIAVVNQGLEKLPDSDLLLNTLLGLQLDHGEFEQAKTTIQKLKEIGFNDALLGLYQAQILVHEKKWQEAIDKLTLSKSKLIHDPARVTQIEMLLAHCKQAVGDLEGALALYRGISSQTSGLSGADLGEANILAQTGKNDEALRHYEAIAKTLGDNLLDNQNVWHPLLQLRKWDQLRQPKDKRDWSKVDQLLEQVKESGKVDPIPLVLLEADILTRKEQADAARALYARALGQNPANEALWMARVNLELETAGPDSALQLAEHVPSTLQQGLFMRLVCALIFGRMEGEAGKTGLMSLEKDSETLADDVRYRLLQGLVQEHRRRNDTESVKRVLGVIMSQRANDLFSRGLLFDIAREEGDVEGMQRLAGEIRRIAEPKSPFLPVLDAVTTISKVRRSAKVVADEKRYELTEDEKTELGQARKLLEDAAKANVAWNEPHKWLADIHALQSNADGMLEALRAAARLGPLEPERTRQLYELLVGKGLNEEAQDVFKKLPRGNLIGTEWVQINSLIQSKRFDEARQVLDTVTPTEGASAADLLRYADARLRVGDLDKAETVLRRALEADGEASEAWVLLVNTLVSANKLSEAEKTIEQAKTRLPADRRDFVLAQCYEAISDPERAEKSYLQAVAAKPRDLRVNKSIANFYLRTTKSERATKYLDAIAKESAAAKSDGDREIVAWARRAQRRPDRRGWDVAAIQASRGDPAGERSRHSQEWWRADRVRSDIANRLTRRTGRALQLARRFGAVRGIAESPAIASSRTDEPRQTL